MKTIRSFAALALAASFPVIAEAQTTVFSDNFGSGSTLDGATATPTANSTSYQVASTKVATGSSLVGPGDLKLTFPSTSSGIAEIQAVFTTTPVSLVTVGDTVTLSVVFTDTSGIFPVVGPSGSSFLSEGLYNSGGVAPVPNGGLANSGIGTGTTFATGHAQNWLGYIGRVNGLNNNSVIDTRPAQSGANNVSQELIGANFSSSGGYANPVQLHAKASSALSVSTGDLLAFTIQYTLSAAGTITIADTLTDQTTATQLFTDSASASGANFLTANFDALAFGYRSATNNGAALTMDISQITVTDTIQPVPEPGTLALMGIGAAAAFGYYRRQRK
jgi:hypothetical protein